jgi:hypothetical protein
MGSTPVTDRLNLISKMMIILILLIYSDFVNLICGVDLCDDVIRNGISNENTLKYCDFYPKNDMIRVVGYEI